MFIAARLAARQAAVGAIANTTAGAVAAACTSPSPIAGTGYTYTFTYAYNTGCAGASSLYGAKLWDRHDDHLHARRDGRRLQL